MPIPADQTLNFSAWVPLRKSVPSADGSIIVDGIISDASLDVMGERVDQASLASSVPYLERYGKLNWDHGPVDIGEVFECRRITAAEAAAEFGKTLDPKGGYYIRGRLYPLGDPGLAPEDLKTAHHRAQVGARLGFSLHGKCLRKGGVCYADFVPKIALTPQPVNMNAVARVQMHKSLSAAMAAQAEAQADDEQAEAVIVCEDLPEVAEDLHKSLADESMILVPRSVWLSTLLKSLEAGSGVNAAEFTGGRALQGERGGKRNGKRRKRQRQVKALKDCLLNQEDDEEGALDPKLADVAQDGTERHRARGAIS